jgi:hypothetical protein
MKIKSVLPIILCLLCLNLSAQYIQVRKQVKLKDGAYYETTAFYGKDTIMFKVPFKLKGKWFLAEYDEVDEMYLQPCIRKTRYRGKIIFIEDLRINPYYFTKC